MSRNVGPWRGAADDTPIPPRVRMRVFEAYGGLCHCCGTPIAGKPFDIDHVVPLIMGGSNSEGNLAPILRDHHRDKTRADVAAKAKVARMKARHLGVSARQASRPMPGSRGSKWKRKMDGTVVRRDE